MKFYDIAKISVSSWRWWDWSSAGRREKWIPFGWPAWGDGWKWWSVILKASKDVNTLIEYSYKKQFKARPWEMWMSHDRYWKDSDDLILEVPVWTVVKQQETNKILFQFKHDQEEFVVARWWKWWLGNIHFKNSTRQFPDFAIMWEPGEKKEIMLELQLLWDVALIWTPSVWKSSIINAVSNAKVKVWDYPFTTLIPNLWIVKYGDYNFSIVDVPGLIQWASEWRGLWNEFLRHVLKAKNWTFVTDISRYESWLEDFWQLIEEIVKYVWNRFMGSTEYGAPIKSLKIKISMVWSNIVFEAITKLDKQDVIILRKVLNFVVNKFDVIDDQEILHEYLKTFVEAINKWFSDLKNLKQKNFSVSVWKISKKDITNNIHVMSVFTRYWLDDFLKNTINNLQNFDSKDVLDIEFVKVEKEEKNYIIDITKKERTYLLENGYINETDAKYIKIWEVYDNEVSRLVFTLPWWNDEAEYRFWNTLDRKWYMSSFEKHGIQKWDVIKIISVYEWIEDRYIMWD